MIRGRLRRHPADQAPAAGEQEVEIDPAELTGVFRVPNWLRDVGLMSWLLVGVTVLLCGLVWLLTLTQVITIPVIVAGIIAVVGSPLVAWMQGHHIPRALGAALLMLAVVLIGIGVGVLIVVGIDGEAASIAAHLDDAKDKLSGWLQDLGLDQGKADQAKQDLGNGAADGVSALLDGVLSGISAFSSLAFFVAMTVLSLFFLLKDGPSIRDWTESHIGLPAPVARIVTDRTIGSMRGYFLGTTLVALFSAVVVAIGSLIIGVPLIGTIVAVTFIAGYVPYIGAWSAAAFTVLLALGSEGTAAAGGMVFVQLLANGPLQQMIQPFAMGTALGIHPLAVLIVTISGGALFGTVGLIVAAPLVAAGVRISADLARARAAEQAAEAEAAGRARGPAGHRLTGGAALPRGAFLPLATLAASAALVGGCSSGSDDGATSSTTVDPTTSTPLYFTAGEQLEKLPGPAGDPEASARALVAGPQAHAPGEAGTEIPAGTRVRDVSVDDGTATVAVSERFVANLPARPSRRTPNEQAELDARLAQVTFTLTGREGIERTRVVAGGVDLGTRSRSDFARPEGGPPERGRARKGPGSAAVGAVQKRLARLRYLPKGAVDGVDGYRTRQAVMAFQAWEGLDRDGIAGPLTKAALADARRPQPKGDGPGRRLEVYRGKGVTLIVKHDRTKRAIHSSSGAPGYTTPAGRFEVFRKEVNSWSVPYQVWLPWASYFNAGIAFHGYRDIPPYPASHGCVRVPEPEAEHLYDFARIGTPVIVR